MTWRYPNAAIGKSGVRRGGEVQIALKLNQLALHRGVSTFPSKEQSQ
jgi:hypothetical protein